MTGPRAPLATADLVAAGAAGVCVLLLLLFPILARPLGTVLTDLGGPPPVVTRAALTWLGPALGGVTAVVVVAGLRARKLVRRRLALIAAIAVAMVGLAGCYIAVQWPLFTVLGKIKPD